MKSSQYMKESVERQFPNGDAPIEAYLGFADAYCYVVYHMYDYFNYLKRPQLIFMNDLSSLIVPICANPKDREKLHYPLSDPLIWVDFRTQPVTFANGDRTVVNDRKNILRRMQLLVDGQNDLTAEEFYFFLEDLHPWPEGNGRVGSLLWNLLNRSIMDPEHPPINPEWHYP